MSPTSAPAAHEKAAAASPSSSSRTERVGFPDTFIDDVRRTADIVRVIQDHVPLRKMGNSWKGLCPFHKEKTPSFNVRSDPPVFHCFGCGEGGDVFRFIMMYDR